MTATDQESVTTGPLRWEPPLPDRSWRPSTRLVGWLLLGVVGATLIGLSVVTVPYYTLSPGSAIGVGELVTAGEEGRIFEAEGDVLLTTVSVSRDRVSPYEALWGWLKSDVDVISEDLLFPPGVGDQTEFNLALMNDSKTTAALVAFRHLGVKVAERGQGALVVAVEVGFPAEPWLRPGDVIVAVDGRTTTTSAQVVNRIGSRSPGDEIRLQVLSLRDDTIRDIPPIRLGNRGDGTPILGVQLQTYRAEFDFPFEVDIESGQIGGPSAGLAFTLAILDALTPGDLTGGERVAVTGTIGLDGAVGPVGGVAQKARAVRKSDATLFLVPSSELEDARRVVSDRVRVEPVDSLDEALAVLASVGGNVGELALPSQAAA